MFTKFRTTFRSSTLQNNVLFVGLVCLLAYFALNAPNFLTTGNLLTLANNGAALAVLVVPFTLLVISGNVDFSVGSTAALSATITAVAITEWHVPQAVGIVLGLVVGAVVGAVNGAMCALLGFNSIIVTLGALGVIRGATMLIHQDQIFGLGSLVQGLGSNNLLGVPITLWIALAIFVLGGSFLAFAPGGRHVLAIGINKQAAYLSALSVRWLPFWLYTVTGLGAGIAGVILMARLNGVSPGSTGIQMELQVLTVVLLGGTAFAGGRGRLFGVFVAWLFLAALQNGLVLMNVTANLQTLFGGLALVGAAALEAVGTVLAPKLKAKRLAEQQSAGLSEVTSVIGRTPDELSPLTTPSGDTDVSVNQ